ncbi:mRNA splicing protein SYF1 NDAI_0A04100 [Naumovozyma dairenensis CBS 421]|uniref:Pre-mRNA-splicing factor SYF1 n=1 Tax=Naumovozyma dairenensis (strain ATCC 10597 / BCRC 20456 / CBS 421 / NBRC 0211 / NRRL Y-12639) TaxID=1071378 RepID=G0W429_NAUDC|nr:hypothetical protein NDAI_0A04100 [Naumovozyma dairenensis CBS 421]CCD22567.1 hypothetical protein NDAI_0A04100 [Naumovozyma dairenensis CBS 421]
MEAFLNEDDIAFEYELQKDPQNLTAWKRYLDHWKSQLRDPNNKNSKRTEDLIEWLYERLLLQFVDDGELWMEYITWQNDRFMANKFKYSKMTLIFQKCLDTCQEKTPTDIYFMFLDFALEQYDLKLIREVFDISITRLKIQDQGTLWGKIIEFIYEKFLPLTFADEEDENDVEQDQYDELQLLIYKTLFATDNEITSKNNEETDFANVWASHFLRRYILVCPPSAVEQVLQALYNTKDYNTAIEIYKQSMRETKGTSTSYLPTKGSSFDINLNYLKMLESLKLEKEYELFAEELEKQFPTECLTVTILKAKHYIKQAKFDQFEELLQKSLKATSSVHDFTILYNLHLNFEQAFLETIINELKDNKTLQTDPKWEELLSSHFQIAQDLTVNYKLKMNNLKLRQNPNMISTWNERVALFEAKSKKVEVYTEAIMKIDPLKVITRGVFGKLWVSYAQIYWDSKNYDSARQIYESALKVPFPYIEDLEEIWTTWINNELELDDGVQRCLLLLDTALIAPDHPDVIIDKFRASHGKVPAQTIVFNSLKLWSLKIDLLEMVNSTFENEKIWKDKIIETYESAIKLKILSPMMFINYAHFLKNCGRTLDSYQVYERAVAIFTPETQNEIWNIYLSEVVESSIISKEHIRELFDQSLRHLIQAGVDCKALFILYSKYEAEKNGLIKKSVDILLDGAKNNGEGRTYLNSRLTLWDMCISEAESNFGISVARELYEQAITALPNSKVIPYILKFAHLEAKSKEVTRAREIMEYGAKLLPPVENTDLWEHWDKFELEYGNKETYKNMLRLKRQLENEMKIDTEEASHNDGNVQFVTAAASAKQQKTMTTSNPEEIELDL